MAKLILVPVLHTDALDEFPKQQKFPDVRKQVQGTCLAGDTSGHQFQGLVQEEPPPLLQPGSSVSLLHPRGWHLRSDSEQRPRKPGLDPQCLGGLLKLQAHV